MLLEKILEGLEGIRCNEEIVDVEIASIAYDSRKVTRGSLFVCVEGYRQDGHEYVDDAIRKGAIAILACKEIEVPKEVILIKHHNTRKALAEVSSNFYQSPTKKINLIGVTGTKGKTTTTFMIKSMLEQKGHKVGLIGTIANYVGEKIIPSERTTPESLELQQMFLEMKEQGVDSVVMEVSSHSLDLYRVHACEFDVGVFANLSRDHLDFHMNFENYFDAKSKLFDICKYGVVNIDDQYGRRILEESKCETISFGIENESNVRAENIKISPEGTRFEVVDKRSNEKIEISVPIPGRFSAYNALAAIAACQRYDISVENIINGLKSLKVPGRAETVETNGEVAVVVDYAHSPDSLENILQAVNAYATGRIVVIFGCGGDRDRTKRPIMGEIAGKLAGFTVITSDNPRTEDPDAIIAEIEEGIKKTRGEYIIISDRRKAIEYAIKNFRKDDVILIAGKGHETYQIFKDRTIHFDDREAALEVMGMTKGDHYACNKGE